MCMIFLSIAKPLFSKASNHPSPLASAPMFATATATAMSRNLLHLPVVVVRTFCSSHSTPSPSGILPLTSTYTELSIAEEILHILHSPHSQLERSLDVFLPVFTPHLVSSVLELSPPPASAFRFFNWASRRTQLRSKYSYSLLVSLLSSHPSAFGSAWMSLHHMRRDAIPISPHSFEALIYAYDQRGLLSKAVESFDRMPEFGCRPSIFVYNVLISAFVKRGLFLPAMGIYSHMRKSGYSPIRPTFTILVDALCREGRSGDAFHLFEEMSDRGFAPNAMVYTLVIRGLCKEKRMDDALRLFHSMRANGMHRCKVTCSTLLDGFCRAGSVDHALRLLGEFAEEGIAPGLHDYTSLLNALFACGRFEEASRLFRTMVLANVPFDCVFYTTMIRGCVDHGRSKEAFAFLGEMIKRGIDPDGFCYNTLLSAIRDVGDLNEAFSLMLRTCRHPDFPTPESYNIVIRQLCNNGMVTDAQKVFKQMGDRGCFPTVVTFNTLISTLCKLEDVKAAHNLFCKMDIPRNPSLFLRVVAHLQSNPRTLHEQMEHHLNSGHVLQAYNILRLLSECGAVQPDIATYSILIKNLCRDKRLDEALKLVKLARVRGFVPTEFTYGTLINGFRNSGRFEEALVFIDDVLKDGGSRAPSRPFYHFVTRSLCRMKQVTRAVHLWLSYISKLTQLSAEEAHHLAAAKKLFEEGSTGEMVRCLVEGDAKWHTDYASPCALWICGFREVDKLDEAHHIFALLRANHMEVSPPASLKLFQALCSKGNFRGALDVLSYIVERGYSLHPNFLLPDKLLPSIGRSEVVASLAAQLDKSGCSFDENLETKIWTLLNGNALE